MRQSLAEIRQRADRIRQAAMVRQAPTKTAPLYIPTHLAEELKRPKKPGNTIDIDKLAAEAKKKFKAEKIEEAQAVEKIKKEVQIAKAKKLANTLDIDKIAADAKNKSTEDKAKQAEEIKAQTKVADAQEQQKLLDYARKAITKCKKSKLLTFCDEADLVVKKANTNKSLVNDLIEACKERGTEWLLKMI